MCGPVRSNTTVPTPKILDWSDDPSNAIGSEYVITEHAAGVQLHQKWPTMSGEQQIVCIQAICMSIQQIAVIDFPAYGSLYFIDAPLHSACTLPFTQSFCIGSHCGTRYWDCNVGEARYYNSTKPNRGPCEFHCFDFYAARQLIDLSQGLVLPHIATASSMLVYLDS